MITNKLQVIKPLCKGCGVCAAICQRDAIVMQRNLRGLYTPRINKSKCSRCMLCVQSCPAVPVCFADKQFDQVLDISDEYLLGPCLRAYAGYSTSEDIRYKAASGGIVSSLLLNALENGTIDSALTVELSADEPFEAHAVVARNKQRILQSMGSKYLPVEFSTALKQIIRDNSIKRIGIVGLPCHIEGIRKASLLIPNFRKKIVFTIGLFCKQTKDLRFTDLVLAKMGVAREQVHEIKFRGDGWPGYIRATLKNGDIVRYPYEAFNSLWGIFSCSPVYCLLCSFPMAEFADISVGDAWLDEYRGDKAGISLFLVRTEAGVKIVDQAIRDERIHIEAVDSSRVVDAQPRFVVIANKVNLECRLQVLRLFDRKIPNLHIKQTYHGALGGYLEALWILGVRYVTSSALFRQFFPFFPSLMLKMLSRGTTEVWKILSRFRRVN